MLGRTVATTQTTSKTSNDIKPVNNQDTAQSEEGKQPVTDQFDLPRAKGQRQSVYMIANTYSHFASDAGSSAKGALPPWFLLSSKAERERQ